MAEGDILVRGGMSNLCGDVLSPDAHHTTRTAMRSAVHLAWCLVAACGLYVAYEIFVDVPKIAAEATEPVKGKR